MRPCPAMLAFFKLINHRHSATYVPTVLFVTFQKCQIPLNASQVLLANFLVARFQVSFVQLVLFVP